MTVPANLAGLPCTSVPFHKSGQMPLGMQIIGPFGSDFRVLSSSQLLQNLVSE